MIRRVIKYLGMLALMAGVLLSSAGVSRAVTYELVTGTTTVVMPDGKSVLMWGFGLAGGAVTVPGPELVVPAGENLTINLTNNLPVPVSIVIPGLGLGAVPTPVIGTDGRVQSFTSEAAAGGGTQSYTFAARPGTFLYESGTDPALQVQMGLYGSVRAVSGTAGQAYDSAVDPAGLSAFDAELTYVFSEIDPALHDAVQAGTFGTAAHPSTVENDPKYYLINGAPFSAASVPAYVGVAGSRVLLRLVNAGVLTHVPTMQGLTMTAVAADGYFLPYPDNRIATPLEAGKTKDVLVTLPANGKYALYDRRLDLANNLDAVPGGMTTFLSAGPGGPISTLTLTPSVTPGVIGSLTAWNAAATGGTGAYEFSFWQYTPAKVWVNVQPWSGLASWLWYPTVSDLGSSLILVQVRTAGSTGPKELQAMQWYLVNYPPINVALSPSVSPGTAGTMMTWTATATGGSGAYQYYFWWYDPSKTWNADPAGWKNTNTWDWTPRNPQDVGPNLVLVQVRTLGSAGGKEAQALTWFTVNAP